MLNGSKAKSPVIDEKSVIDLIALMRREARVISDVKKELRKNYPIEEFKKSQKGKTN